MHEFSIAQNIAEIAETTALENNANQVETIEIELGLASGVIKEALEFAWDSISTGSVVLKNAQLKIHEIPVLVKCNICQMEYSPEELFDPCPGCSEVNVTIIQGKELRVKSISINRSLLRS
jgi:hydrogenase nickel incorporation protein HypA/HybF